MTLLVHEVLLDRGQTFAVAESLTGGGLGAAVTSLPGVSATFRGGVIAYATELKAELLGVDRGLLADRGAVDPEVAITMAEGVRDRLGATWGLSTTGVAGPDPQDGHQPGEVYVGVAGPGGFTRVADLRLSGHRDAIRHDTVEAALSFLHEALVDGNAAG